MLDQATTTDAPLSIGRVESPRQFFQLCVLCSDGSSSMTEAAINNITKAQAVNNATRELLTRLKASRVRQNFKVAVLHFDQRTSVRLQPTDVGPALDDNGDFDPLAGHGGGTRIDLVLEEAERQVADFLRVAPAEGVPHSAVILLLSDGCCNEPDKTRAVAARIKAAQDRGPVRICAALFARVGQRDAAGEALLRDVVTDPVMGYKTVYDGDALRDFFERSISAASGGIQIA